MQRVSDTSLFGGASVQGRFDAVLMGRLGSELADIYHDTLRSPLPAGLQRLIEQLEEALREAGDAAEWPDEGSARL